MNDMPSYEEYEDDLKERRAAELAAKDAKVASWRRVAEKLEGEKIELKAQLAAHREFAKAFDAWEERDLHYVDTALDKARKALEDK